MDSALATFLSALVSAAASLMVCYFQNKEAHQRMENEQLAAIQGLKTEIELLKKDIQYLYMLREESRKEV